MRQLRSMCLAVLALLILALMATTSASATLPTVLLLPGEGSMAGSGTVEGTEVGSFNSSLVSLTATLALGTTEIREDMASSGPATVLFEGVTVKGSTTHCNTAGDKEGTILLDSLEYHLVLGLSGELLSLMSGPETTLSCTNGLKIKMRGTVLAKLSPFGQETQTLTGEMLCEGASNRTPKWTEYDTDTGMGTAKLEANGGLGWNAACLLVSEPLSGTTASMGAEVMEP